jgi:hypothetical protein
VRVIYTTVFEYQNQVIFNMTVFGVGPSLSNWHLLLACNQKRRFWNTKSESCFNMTLFEGGSRCQTKSLIVITLTACVIHMAVLEGGCQTILHQQDKSEYINALLQNTAI